MHTKTVAILRRTVARVGSSVDTRLYQQVRDQLTNGTGRDLENSKHVFDCWRQLDRRLAQGRCKKEIIRCLKRYVARYIHRLIRADLATLKTRLHNLWERLAAIHAAAVTAA